MIYLVFISQMINKKSMCGCVSDPSDSSIVNPSNGPGLSQPQQNSYNEEFGNFLVASILTDTSRLDLHNKSSKAKAHEDFEPPA